MHPTVGPDLAQRAVAALPATLDQLRRYVGAETPSGDAAALDAFADVLLADAAALGGSGRRINLGSEPSQGDGVVMEFAGAGAGSGAAPALLLAHHDTVHPVGSLAGPVPLQEGPEVWKGPGVYDMKGGLVAALLAVRLLQESGTDHRPVRLVLTPDEEVGSSTSRGMVELQAADVAYAIGFEPPHPGGGLKTSRRGSTRFRISVTGRASHAALDPEAGISAIDELVDQLMVVRGIIAEHPDVMCNTGTIAGGGRANVVADAAHVDLGLRFITGETEAVVLARLAALTPVRPGAVLTTTVLSNRPAWGPSAEADALLARVAAAGAAVGQTVTGAAAAGAADTNITGAIGVPSLDGFGPLGGGAHAVTEHVVVASIAERAALVAAVLALV